MNQMRENRKYKVKVKNRVLTFNVRKELVQIQRFEENPNFHLLQPSQNPHDYYIMDSQEILAVHSILHLIFHRNKNQHHRTKWWKWLSILKRATLDLTRSNAVESQKHLATYVIPRCYMYE